MRVLFRIAVVATAMAGVAVGVALILVRGWVVSTAGDCPPPAGSTGGYRCYVIGHPHVALGVVVVLASALASVIL